MPPQRTSRGQVAKVHHVSGYRRMRPAGGRGRGRPHAPAPRVPSAARQRAQEAVSQFHVSGARGSPARYRAASRPRRPVRPVPGRGAQPRLRRHDRPTHPIPASSPLTPLCRLAAPEGSHHRVGAVICGDAGDDFEARRLLHASGPHATSRPGHGTETRANPADLHARSGSPTAEQPEYGFGS